MVKNQVVVPVLGMHRSGTSAITRGLNLLGVDLGKDILEASADNPRGYWENRLFLNINEELLAMLGLSWHSLRLVEEGFERSQGPTELRSKALEGMVAEFGESPRWGFKDPRTPRLLPFWQETFRVLGAEDRYILVLRHPLSVAHSLQKRDGFILEKGVLLWLLHTLPAILYTTGRPRVVVDYDRLLAQPGPELQRLAERLALPQPSAAELVVYEREFLDPGLRHHVPAAAEPAVGEEMAFTLYALLRRVAADELDLEEAEITESVRSMWSTVNGRRSVYAHLDQVDQRLVRITEEVAAQAAANRAELERQNDQLAQLESQLLGAIRERDQRIAMLTQALNAVRKPPG